MKKPILSLCILLQSISAIAQAPFIFKSFDLNPGSSHSNPVNFTESGGKLFFVAQTANEGTELWVTDGTAAGTKIVKDISAGIGSGLQFSEPPMAYNGKVYFGADNGTNGTQLWVSDGTAAGTYMLKNIATVHTTPGNFYAVLNGKLYFAATDGTNGNELWETDGTAAGTVLAADITPGAGNSHPAHFCVYNSTLYFQAKNDFYKFNNIATGASLAATICPTPSSATAYPINMTVLNGKMIFSANDCLNGEELWTSDGIPTGTSMLQNIMSGSGGGCKNTKPYLCNNKAFFVADNGTGAELWVTDGTPTGTTQLRDIYPGQAGSLPSAIVAMGNRVFFSANDGTNGMELWVSDGTSAGTQMVKDIFPGATGSQYIRTVVYKNYLYFAAQQATGDFRLYRTNGTAAGTQMITPAGSVNANPATVGQFFVFNGALYFGAQFNPTIGQELWSLTDTTGTTPPPNAISHTAGNSTGITLYPNPAHHNFTIKTTTTFTKGSVTLTDATGKVVMDKYQITNSQTRIPLNNIAPGIYMADIWLDDTRSTQKLVIE